MLPLECPLLTPMTFNSGKEVPSGTLPLCCPKYVSGLCAKPAKVVCTILELAVNVLPLGNYHLEIG